MRRLQTFLPLALALAALAAMLTFSESLLMWEWMGRPSGPPHLLYRFIGLPAALVAVSSGAWIAWKSSTTAGAAGAINRAALAICSMLCLISVLALAGLVR